MCKCLYNRFYGIVVSCSWELGRIGIVIIHEGIIIVVDVRVIAIPLSGISLLEIALLRVVLDILAMVGGVVM